MSDDTFNPRIAPAAAPHLPPLTGMVFRLMLVVWSWEIRRRTRRQLARLPEEVLDDIAVTPDTAAAEAGKPFWRA